MTDKQIISRRPLRFLILCGSNRHGSHTHALTKVVNTHLSQLGAESRLIAPQTLPLFNPDTQPIPTSVQTLVDAARWADGHIWASPEYHGSLSGCMKNQLDWLSFQDGKTLAVLQVSGGVTSFNTVNQLRLIGNWLRMTAVPSHLCIPHSSTAFTSDGQIANEDMRDRLTHYLQSLMTLTHRLRH